MTSERAFLRITCRRFMEDNPKLVTSYALLALAYCLPPAGK
jgi:hypothetical protein